MELNSKIQFAGIIPARYASTRFPGKPLALIGDKTMIRRVYEQASKSLELVYVATDDQRIADTVRAFGGKIVMTSPDHQSGTDRVAEAADLVSAQTGRPIDVVVNIQGDEPFIKPEQINLVKECFADETVEIATLVRKAEPGEDIFNPNQPKVVISYSGDAIYFSRAAIPYIQKAEKDEWPAKHTFYKHIGLYAYRTETLKRLTKLARSPLEIAESLEQNRWLENGYRIRTAVTIWESVGIDTPEDLERARLFLEQSS
jgi:3-deoxy-manno-octulosonate cytidylyltransferase (CMP-KDO synthetase)